MKKPGDPPAGGAPGRSSGGVPGAVVPSGTKPVAVAPSGGKPVAVAPVAVAIEHDPAVGGAPKVVASGRGFVAEQILELAFAHGIKVRQDADLAQILAVLDLDSDIPPEAFAAVAEILVYVYRANAAAPAVDPGGPLSPPILPGQDAP